MAKNPADKVWKNGSLLDWDQATIHVMAHVVNYGSALFEGIRCYDTDRGPAIFRLDRHVERVFDSCKIYRMDIPFSREEICQGCIDIVRANSFRSCYLRPLIFRGYGVFGESPALSGRSLRLLLRVGPLPGKRGFGAGRRCLRLLLEPAGTEHISGHGKVRGQLHEFTADMLSID